MRNLPRRITATGLAAAFLLVLFAMPADAHKKKKKKKKKKQQAAETLAEALDVADRSLWAYDTDGASEALESVTGEATPEVLLLRARILEQRQSYEKAADGLGKAADAAPADPAPLVFLGETYLHAEDQTGADRAFAEAEARAKAVLAEKPENPRALYYLGVAQQRQKKFDDAVRTLEKVRALEPKNALAAYQLGATRAFRKEWNEAVDTLTEAIELDSGIAYAFYYRGLAAGQAGRKDLLINDLDRFLFMAPDAPEATRAQKVRNAG